MVGKEFNQIVQIVDGSFSPTEASDMLNELIKSRINFHNIQMLRMWEGNHHYNSNEWDKKIEVLKKERAEAIALLAKAKKEGFNVEIIGDIKVRLSN